MRAIMINPAAQTVEEVTYNGDPLDEPSVITWLRTQLGCAGVDVAVLDEDVWGAPVDCWIDEHGMESQPAFWTQVPGFPRPLAGKMVMFSHYGGSIVSLCPWVTKSVVEDHIQFVSVACDRLTGVPVFLPDYGVIGRA